MRGFATPTDAPVLSFCVILGVLTVMAMPLMGYRTAEQNAPSLVCLQTASSGPRITLAS